MVKIACAFLLVVCGILPAVAQQRAIKSLTVKEVGLDLGPDKRNPPDMCKPFRPTKSQIRRYFTKAYPVPDVYVIKDRYTPCHATGTIEFSDGFGARWEVFSSGSAWLYFDFGGRVALYYRDRKWYDPTDCTYGAGDPSTC